ncbi:transcriptional regulator TrmB protein [Halorhabdus tiamatea SARL4B]|uniref:Archaeal sugar-specific transcriptional regulator, TrmB family n=1 Tax=Halorhabdus tiamatea SARL4B TaxID=1033806 RepID=F7PIR9_9EURY|nr:TrmB family transcriptional regulator [Halorhabdus tiamatea]ERJ05412.1 transcriptional regulator TrmB protein [Halorhabdus tiamatea SARL4B]CCQ33362.1 archaeal sugar-specific transcriptional regulator, TrmB family [Halorhabdus tiamatea SARL4B]
MDEEELRDALENTGLTSYQSDAYLAVLELGVAAAVKVARNCSVPVSQIYKVLRDLEEKGFVETIERDQLHVRPRDPDVVLEELRSTGQLLQQAADDIEDRWEQPQLYDDDGGVVKHQETLLERAKEAIEGSEMLIEIVLTPAQFETLHPALVRARENGVIVRVTLYDEQESVEIATDIDVEAAVSELRLSYIPGPFLAVVDRDRCFFTPDASVSDQHGLLVEDEMLSFIFHWYFYTCNWALNDRAYVDTTSGWTYVTLEEFVRDFAVLLDGGVDVSLTVTGYDNGQGEIRTISGLVSDISYPNDFRKSGPPTIEQLSGSLTVLLDLGTETYELGSWGAVYEDMEVYRIEIDDITLSGIDDDLSKSAQPIPLP